jgi:hypothetical protein
MSILLNDSSPVHFLKQPGVLQCLVEKQRQVNGITPATDNLNVLHHFAGHQRKRLLYPDGTYLVQ